MYSFKAFLLLSVLGLAQLAAASPVPNGDADPLPTCAVFTQGDGTNPNNLCTICNSNCVRNPQRQPGCCHN
ncbi:hypothetical protein M0657_012281 [Pyricularia oryzae]|uniref:Uncharacterized protein n=1 Tax=Pyricularia oryzae (strain Y34) TaxID=1143189 RepID=A0AA97NSZ1_PYRO3|nr:hypothetical protein OOU_Y34scaffold00691g11 [Pyricularia oryzae Y34]KAI7908375.1 hypothetical protein M9X92_012223 [Pyricularia oryzae]KAI7908460.1 hypothetical protein M0657_012281 [Pyricularia oryzae]